MVCLYLELWFSHGINLYNTQIDGHTVIVNIQDGELQVDKDSKISSDGHVWYGKGTQQGFGGSYGGIGGNCEGFQQDSDPSYGFHDFEFKEEYLNVSTCV